MCVCVSDWIIYSLKCSSLDSWDNISSSLVSASCPAIISNLLPSHFAEQKTCTRQLLAFLIWVTFYSLQTHSKNNTSNNCKQRKKHFRGLLHETSWTKTLKLTKSNKTSLVLDRYSRLTTLNINILCQLRVWSRVCDQLWKACTWMSDTCSKQPVTQSMDSIDVIYFSPESTQFRYRGSGFIASDMSLWCSFSTTSHFQPRYLWIKKALHNP